MPSCYQVNVPLVQGEIIDGEAIVLHLQRGNYFSTQGSGALIWAGIEQQAPVAAIAAALEAHYGLAPAEALEAVRSFAATLAQHDLVREAGSAGAEAVTLPEGLDSAFAAPSLEVYTDMQDLLLLDPIHDVDQAGWPLPPQQKVA